MRNKKGFTVVECIIAIAIVLSVSVSALSVLQLTSNAINNQWDYYRSTVTANNFLNSFMSSDNHANFEKLLDITKINGTDVKNQIQIEDEDKVDEYDLTKQPVAVSFDSIYAYEEGKVSFYNGQKLLTTFDYQGNATSYEKDVHGSTTTNAKSLDKCGLYDIKESKAEGGFSNITVNFTGRIKQSIGRQYYMTDVYSISKSSVGINQFTECSGGILGSDEECAAEHTHNAISSITALEAYLLGKGWYLRFDDYSVENASTYVTTNDNYTYDCNWFNRKNKYMYFYVYDSKTNAQVKNPSGKNMYLRVECTQNAKDTRVWATQNSQSSYSKTVDTKEAYDWYDTQNAYFNVTSVKVAYADKMVTKASSIFGSDKWIDFSTDLKDDKGNSFGSFRWYTLPSYVWYYVTELSSDTISYGTTTYEKSGGGLNYTKYTLKTGHKKNIEYAFTNDSDIELYNSDKEMLYRFSSYSVNDNTKFNFLRAYKDGNIKFVYRDSKNNDTVVFSYKSNSALTDDDINREILKTHNYQSYEKVEVKADNTVYSVKLQNNNYQSQLEVYPKGSSPKKQSSGYLTANPFEERLLEEQLLAYFDENSLVGDSSSGTFYLTGYNSKTGEQEVEDGKRLFFKVEYTGTNFSHYLKNGSYKNTKTWSRFNKNSADTLMTFTISSIDYAYVDAASIADLKSKISNVTFQKYMDIDSNDWAEHKNYSYLAYAYLVCSGDRESTSGYGYGYKEFDSISYSAPYDEYSRQNNGVKTDFTIKSLNEVGNGFNIEVESADKSISENIFKNIIKAPNISNTIKSALVDSLGFKEKVLVDGKYKYYKPLEGVDINRFDFDDLNYTITFYDSADREIIKFTYKYGENVYSSEYAQDKNSLTNGMYSEFFGTDKKLKSEYGGTPFLQVNSAQKSVILKNDNAVDLKIFKTLCENVKVKILSKSLLDGISLSNQDNYKYLENAESITAYYTMNFGKYICFASVTYSKITFRSEIDPIIKVWILKKDNYTVPNTKSNNYSNSEETEVWNDFIATLGTPYIKYRKG